MQEVVGLWFLPPPVLVGLSGYPIHGKLALKQAPPGILSKWEALHCKQRSYLHDLDIGVSHRIAGETIQFRANMALGGELVAVLYDWCSERIR